jgi:hypothetical protein
MVIILHTAQICRLCSYGRKRRRNDGIKEAIEFHIEGLKAEGLDVPPHLTSCVKITERIMELIKLGAMAFGGLGRAAK